MSCGPADPSDPRPHPVVEVAEGPPLHTGGRVLRLAPHGAGGATLQMEGGRLVRWVYGSG